VVLPAGIVSSGLPAIRATCAELGLGFDPWQVGAVKCIEAKNQAGMYAADTVVISIPRQVGKTYLIGAVIFARCIQRPGITVVWTAHRFKVARETFMALKGIATSEKLAPHVDPDAVHSAAGNESITFRNGSRIVFAARERGAIRGFSKVEVLVLDEAQILTEAAMSDMAPTQNQADNPQMFLMGTPPKPTDPSETFTHLRSEALEGSSEALCYIEFSAHPDTDPESRQAIREANPSVPARTSWRAIDRLRKLLSNDDDYSREVLGRWDGNVSAQVIDPEAWRLAADELSLPGESLVLAVDVSPDRLSASIGLASLRSDGSTHVEVIDTRPNMGTGWVVHRLKSFPQMAAVKAVMVDSVGPAASLIPDLRQARIKRLEVLTTSDVKQACGGFFDGVHQRKIRHLGQPPLNAALAGAKKRDVGDAWAWDRKRADVDITPLVAVTLAAHGVSVKRKREAQDGRRSRREAVVM
jgi:hypothetical protein